MNLSIVPSQEIHTLGTGNRGEQIHVGVYGPSHGIRIYRENPRSFSPIIKKVTALDPGVKVLWAPSPIKSNAVITRSGYRDIYQERAHGARSPWCRVRGKVFADGVSLKRHEAFCITSADCPTVVVHGRDKHGKLHVSVAHAGRDSLMHRETLLKTGESRRNFSVLDALLLPLINAGVAKKDIFAHVYCGIRTGFTHPVDHPQHGEYNTCLIEYCKKYEQAVLNGGTGEIDLHALLYAFARLAGIPHENIKVDDIDTGIQTKWASTRRAASQSAGERNLIVVSRA